MNVSTRFYINPFSGLSRKVQKPKSVTDEYPDGWTDGQAHSYSPPPTPLAGEIRPFEQGSAKFESKYIIKDFFSLKIMYLKILFGKCKAILPRSEWVNSEIRSFRGHFLHVPSQWETMLHCNIVSHWLVAYTKWSLGLNELEELCLSPCCLTSRALMSHSRSCPSRMRAARPQKE